MLIFFVLDVYVCKYLNKFIWLLIKSLMVYEIVLFCLFLELGDRY